jgi:hypothetical protein
VSVESLVSNVKEVYVGDMDRGSSSSHSNFLWRGESKSGEVMVGENGMVERGDTVCDRRRLKRQRYYELIELGERSMLLPPRRRNIFV